MEKIKTKCSKCEIEIIYPKNIYAKVINNYGRVICKSCYYKDWGQNKRDENVKDKKFVRNCPVCKTEIIYASKFNLKNAIENNSKCKSCFNTEESNKIKSEKYSGENNSFFGKHHSDETKKYFKKLYTGVKTGKNEKKTLKGEKNGMFGRSFYSVWLEKYGKEEADNKMKEYKLKQSKNNSGKKNSMYGKPSPQGSGNGWSGWYKGWYFRSLNELSYMVNIIERFNLKWRGAETSDLSIVYKDFVNNDKTYFADFLIEEKYLIECKPKKLWDSITVQLKKEAAEIQCKKWGFKYKLTYVRVLTFEEITKLYDEKLVIFLEKYDKKFKKYGDKYRIK